MWSLETLGRERLSRHFWMREFLYSEIGDFHGIPNIPDDPDLALARGRAFCETLLDPLEETFGRIFVRSGYRAARLNAFGNAHGLNCARNDHPLECHVWDLPDRPVAGASIVIPWFARRYADGRDWRDLAWWLHDHLDYSEICFFPKLCAFNLSWRPEPLRRIDSFVAPRGTLLRAGAAPALSARERAARHADFPPFKGLRHPV
ncbi:hypothetical protein [Pseudoponticoccus marisrubri]|uniref:Peptidase M15 n=1 Tax=Pseudoponticoccus marisrubri TaxID=1685382 RepID=A0A0W7WNL8_9RHOB|nr:hypothetical protein [Pseudoponticoccus marisrubri]KUF12156.1 hypothetical protein AVJ23_05800 [Pseudoponticoccus marisrubri]